MHVNRTNVAVFAVGALVAGIVGTTSTPAQATDSTDSPGCATGTVPSVVMGSPDLKAGQAGGVYLWHGSNGYALRATHAGSARVVFTGTIVASRSISHVTGVRLEKNDGVRLSADHTTLTFRFNNYGFIDGVNFAADCSKRLKVGIRINGSIGAPNRVKLGKHRASPTSNPFTIERYAAASPSPSSSPSDTPTATIG
ncbi:MAG: hypothetical protein JWP11_1019 [Frankiales bacterium]|nr:hypothetical protein [Frankiales bacterium]